jgi:uncharacterized damage-inducible protein DinB
MNTLLVEHEYWANTQIADMLLAMDIVPERPKRIFDHIIGAQNTWLARINQQEPSLEIWPMLMPKDWKKLLTEHKEQLLEIASSDEQMYRVITYRNSAGKEFTNRVGDLMMHLALHAQYHRGQVIAYARESIKQPPVTDLIAFLRL